MTAKIKVCGLTCLEDVLDAIELGVDYLGFVFDPQSPYFIEPEQCSEILEDVPYSIFKVGVFSDAEPQYVIDVACDLNLDYLEFNGQETPEYCEQFARPFLKRFAPQTEDDLLKIKNFPADFYLIDSGIQSSGNGLSLTGNCDLARLAKQYGQIFLSKGLNEKNIDMALRTVQPYAVNVNEGVELSTRKKDYAKLQEFVRRVQSCEFTTK